MLPLPISLTDLQIDEVLRYMGTPPDRAGADLRWPLREGERLELRPDLPLEQLTAPVQKGVRIGTLYGAVGDEESGKVPLVCGEAVPRDLAEPRRGLLRRLLDRLEEF